MRSSGSRRSDGRLLLRRFLVISALGLLAGCASVPDASFLQRAYVAQEPEFRTAWGAVSYTASLALGLNHEGS